MQPTHPIPAPKAGASAQLLAGALAQLTAHLDSTCPHAAHRARRLLAEIAGDEASEAPLRQQAESLCEVLERNAVQVSHAARVRR
jgi:hypothetical protein